MEKLQIGATSLKTNDLNIVHTFLVSLYWIIIEYELTSPEVDIECSVQVITAGIRKLSARNKLRWTIN